MRISDWSSDVCSSDLTAITGGLRGDLGGWQWDLSTTYGKDRIKAYTLGSVNADLFAETGSRQQDFYDGSVRASEWTSNLDISRNIADIATLAFAGRSEERTAGKECVSTCRHLWAAYQ